MNKILTTVFACAAASAVCAQVPPPEVSSLFGEKAVAGSLTVITKLTAEQRAFFWKDKHLSPAGYLHVQTTPAYLDIVSDFRSDLKKIAPTPSGKPRSSSDRLPDNLVYSGSITEDEHRSTFIFDDSSGGAVLTVWNFKRAGAKVVVIDEALTQIVGGSRGTLALSMSSGYKKAVWKLTWWNAGVGFELYVPDMLDAKGLPARRSSDIVRMGAALEPQFTLVK